MRNVRLRASLSLLNVAIGVALLGFTVSSFSEPAVGQAPGGCGDETSANNCTSTGQLCCGGSCYDPTEKWCDCEGNLRDLENSD